VVAALIAIGVIAFLAFDAWVLYRVFKSRASAGDYGSFPVPGETTVTVPAGKLKISYQESYKASSSGDSIDFGTPAALQVQVTSAAGGDPLPIKGPGFRGMGGSLNTGSGWSRSLVGTVQSPEPGSLHHGPCPPRNPCYLILPIRLLCETSPSANPMPS
jgi:hypothetical protein